MPDRCLSRLSREVRSRDRADVVADVAVRDTATRTDVVGTCPVVGHAGAVAQNHSRVDAVAVSESIDHTPVPPFFRMMHMIWPDHGVLYQI